MRLLILIAIVAVTVLALRLAWQALRHMVALRGGAPSVPARPVQSRRQSASDRHHLPNIDDASDDLSYNPAFYNFVGNIYHAGRDRETDNRV